MYALPLLSEDSPNRINLDKHSSFTDRTHLSANAFRFGLLAGNLNGFTPPAFNTSRNDSQNLVSRSCGRYRQGSEWNSAFHSADDGYVVNCFLSRGLKMRAAKSKKKLQPNKIKKEASTQAV